MHKRTGLTIAFGLTVALTALRVQAGEAIESQAHRVLGTVVNYIPNLAMDFVDIFHGTIAIGEGSGGDLRFTRLLEAGWSKYDVTRYGLNGRNRPVFEEGVHDGGVGIAGFLFGELERDPYEIGITVQIVKAGGELSANVRSGLDFLAGIAFIDLEGDNVSYF